MITVDTMVVGYLILDYSQFSGEVRRLFDTDSEWCAPFLWRSELRSTLLQYVRATDPTIPRSELTRSEALKYMRDAEALLADRTLDVDSGAVLRLADGSGCSAYDCEYVALAQDLGTRLVTYDEPLLKAFPDTAVRPSDITS